MCRVRFCLPLAAAFPLACIINTVVAGPASAHVKWFCAFNVAGSPQGLEQVLCPEFELLIALSLLALLAGCLVERTALGAAMVRSLDRATGFVRDNTEALFRVGCAFFFISIWALGGIILTPELKMESTVVATIQLAIAAGTLSRRTMPLSGLGIVVLFAIAASKYGAFHLADYPVFLGVAAYLILTGLQRDLPGVRPIDIVRWTAGITLMWASIEKWAYPQWSLPLFLEHPNLAMGFDPDFIMRAAGAVEFALAFALVWTPLVRRVSAAILAGMFIFAVFEFGKLDLIGHTLIVVCLFAIVADDDTRVQPMHSPAVVPVAYTAALAGFLFVYYMGHALIFGSSIS